MAREIYGGLQGLLPLHCHMAFSLSYVGTRSMIEVHEHHIRLYMDMSTAYVSPCNRVHET